MRLSPWDQRIIVDTVQECIPEARVYLYGSRVDDIKRGGDIDLLILQSDPIVHTNIGKIRWKLWELLGEQKIDILLEQDGKLSSFATMVMQHAEPIYRSEMIGQ